MVPLSGPFLRLFPFRRFLLLPFVPCLLAPKGRGVLSGRLSRRANRLSFFGRFFRRFRLRRRRFLCLPFFRLRLLLLRGEILDDRQFGTVACPIPRHPHPGVSSFASRESCRAAGDDLLRVLLVHEQGKPPPSRVRGVLFPERDQAIG